MEGGKQFCLTDGKGPHEWPVYFYQQIFLLEVVSVLMLVHPCHDLYDVIVYTKQYEDKTKFIFF